MCYKQPHEYSRIPGETQQEYERRIERIDSKIAHDLKHPPNYNSRSFNRPPSAEWLD